MAKQFRGKFPVGKTARRLTVDEQSVLVAAIAHGGDAKEHAVSALAVANGKRVSQIWLTSDAVGDLLGRAQRAMGKS